SEAEREAIAADVIGGLAISHLIEFADHLEPYAPRGLPQIERQLAASTAQGVGDIWTWFVDPQYIQSQVTPRWFGINLFTLALCVNRVKLDALEDDWKAKAKTETSGDVLDDEELDALWRERLPWVTVEGIVQLRSWDALFDPSGLLDGRLAM